MKLIVIIAVLMLSACSTPVPLAAKFPEAPPQLSEKCPQLKLIEGDVITLSNLTKTVTANYPTYYECAIKLDSWVEWYSVQKTIFENAAK
jgi:hypothetical protein